MSMTANSAVGTAVIAVLVLHDHDIGAFEHICVQNALTCARLRITFSMAGGQACRRAV
jgi:hypothetical protein